jgi:pre-mRNA-processing factor 39
LPLVKDFEWSAARESAEVQNGVKHDDSDDDKHARKRPFPVTKEDEEVSNDSGEKRIKKERHESVDGKNGQDENSRTVESLDGLKEDPQESIWTAFDAIKPKIMKSEQLPDLEKFWRPVIESPKDFQAWTSLLQYVDHENDVAAAREAYDTFLRRYPYCYGYWKKWADYEKKKAMKKDCEKVFERGLTAVPLSVDLWLHYLNYCRVHHAAQESFVREQFERAISVCGLEFRSDRLWELYINWEIERDDLRRVFEIYDKLLSIPTQFHTTHWDNFQDLVNSNDPKELLSPEEYEELKLEIFRERKISTEVIADIKLTEEEVQAIRKKTKERRQTVHTATEKEIADRWVFEEGVSFFTYS